jgi:hypothetical protein
VLGIATKTRRGSKSYGGSRPIGKCPICGNPSMTNFPLMFTFLTETIRGNLLSLCRNFNDNKLFLKLEQEIGAAMRKRKPHYWFCGWPPSTENLIILWGGTTYHFRLGFTYDDEVFQIPVAPQWKHLIFLLILVYIFYHVDRRWHHFQTHVPLSFHRPISEFPHLYIPHLKKTPVRTLLTYKNFEAFYRYLYQLPSESKLPSIQQYRKLRKFDTLGYEALEFDKDRLLPASEKLWKSYWD